MDQTQILRGRLVFRVFLTIQSDNPTSLNLAADIVRYVVGAYHPGNQTLKSEVLPRYSFIGWLLNLCKVHAPSFGAAKAALLYDFLFYDPESPNIMNIEPATLLIVRCPYIDLSITLLEYLITEMDKYDPIDPDKKVWKGIHNSIDACLKMKVVRDLSTLKRCMQVSEFLKARFLDDKSPFKPFQGSIEAQPEAAVLEELGLSGTTQAPSASIQSNPKSGGPTGGRPPPALSKPTGVTQQPVSPLNSRPVSALSSLQQPNAKPPPGAAPPRNPQKPIAPVAPSQPTKQAPPRQPASGPLSTSGPQIPPQGPPAPKPASKPQGPPASDLKTSKEDLQKKLPQQGQLKRSHNGDDPLATPPAKKRRIDSSVEEDILNSWTTPNTSLIQQPKPKEGGNIKEQPKSFQAKIKEFSVSLSTNQPGMRNLFDELLSSLGDFEEPLNASEIATILVQTFHDEFKESSQKKLLEDHAYHEKIFSSILFEHAANDASKQKKRPIFSLLAEMQKQEACVGYRFLCFLIGKHSLFYGPNSMELDDDELWNIRMGHESSTDKTNLFKPYLKFLSSYTTDDKLSFVVDCQTCLEHDISLFFSILPILAKYLSDLVVGNHQLIQLICSSVYPAQLQALCSRLILDQFELIGADNVPILLTTSLTWDSFAQFCFWTIVDAEFSQNEVEIIKIFPNFIKNNLKPQVHSEALQGVLSLLGSIFPTKELLEFIFQLPVDLVDFSSMVLARWSNLPRIDTALTKAVATYLKALLKANKTRIRSALRHLTIFYSYHQKMRFPPVGEDTLFSSSIVKASQTLIEKFGLEKDFPLLTSWSEESEGSKESHEEEMEED